MQIRIQTSAVRLSVWCSCGRLAACQTIQYQALEAVGIEKRNILASRVEAASEAQDEAGEQFETTLERFRAVVEFDGGDLERAYRV